MQPFHAQLVDLILIQMTNWRWSWRGISLTSIVAPIMATLAFSAFARDLGPESIAYILTGNMVLSLLFGTIGSVSGNFTYMRMTGMFDYFATLPIYRLTLILASVSAFFVISLPPALITLFLGGLILQLPLQISPLIVIVLPLISLTLCGLGALIGLLGRTPEEANYLSTFVTFMLLGIGPVLIPADRLPGFLHVLGLFSPATYAASALRQITLGQPDRIPVWVDMAVLTLMMGGLLWLVTQQLDWRQK